MISRRLNVLVAPGVPFQHREFRQVLTQLRGQLQLQVYDCESQAEAFDALGHFTPDCIVLDTACADFDPTFVATLLHRATECNTYGEQPAVFIMSDGGLMDGLTGTHDLIVLDKEGLSQERLKKALLAQAKPKAVNLGVPVGYLDVPSPATGSAQYEWMGRTTLTEEAATKALFAEERFRRLVNNSLDLTCVVEADGFIKYASASSERILGIVPDDLAGRYVQDYLPRCKRNNIARWLTRQSVKGGFAGIVSRHQDGRAVYLEASCTDMTADPAIRGFVISARDVSSRRQAEEKLTYQARLLGHIREVVIGLDTDQKIVYMNPAAERIYRIRLAEALGQKWTILCQVEWLHDDEAPFMRQALADHGQWQGEVIHHLPSGRRLHVELSVTAHRETPASKPSLVLVIRDIKDRKVVENVLHESENRYRSLVTVTSDLVWHTDAEDLLTFISPKVTQLLGYAAADLIGKPMERFLAGTDESRALRLAYSQKEEFSYLQGTFLTKDGRVKYLEVSGLPQTGPNRLHRGYHGAIRDVTGRVESERAIRQSLTEKETLIKEIHHRVKNNMQIVSSLLFLQTQFVKDADTLARLQESQDRIRSMALVHEKLYQSTDLSRINFKDYLETLSRDIANSYRNQRVHLVLEMPDDCVTIGIDTAVPCGLIVNELVSNAYKHAFNDGRSGQVGVRLSCQRNKAVLEISDNGPGLPHTDLKAYEETSLGMQLVGALVHQVHGNLEVNNEGGTLFRLRFKLD